jgi:DNA-binding NtrC family response regulator
MSELEDDFQIQTAYNGNDALEKIKEYSPFLIICDINMPKMDGIQLLDELERLNDPTPQVVFMTGFGSYDKSELIKKGAFDMIIKPFNFKVIKEIVNRSIKVMID